MEDMDYLSQQMMVNGGMVPSDLDDQDYFELMNILKAKPREERPISAHEAIGRLRGTSTRKEE